MRFYRLCNYWQEDFDHDLRLEVIKQFKLSLIKQLQIPPMIQNQFAYKLYKRFLKHSSTVLKEQFETQNFTRKSQVVLETQKPQKDMQRYFQPLKLLKNMGFQYFMPVNR